MKEPGIEEEIGSGWVGSGRLLAAGVSPWQEGCANGRRLSLLNVKTFARHVQMFAHLSISVFLTY